MAKKDPKVVILSDGREVKLNLSTITRKDVREAVAAGGSSPEYDALLAKAAGIASADDMGELPILDWKLLDNAVWTLINNPLGADPS